MIIAVAEVRGGAAQFSVKQHASAPNAASKDMACSHVANIG